MRALGNRRFLLSGGFIGVSWLTYFLVAPWAASQIGLLVGSKLLSKADGKFTDPNVFIQGRFREAMLLATAAWILWCLAAIADNFLRRWSVYSQARGIGLGLIGFVAINLWLAVAGQTCLYWAFFFDRSYVDNFAQFQIKKVLLSEVQAPRKVLLIGNSQTNTNLDELTMNKALAGQIWVAEMHQGGACGFDLLMVTRDLRKMEAEYVIAYISPRYFYWRTDGKVASQFFSPEEVPDLLRFGQWSYYPEGALRSGLTSSVLPLFHYRASISQRILGGEITHLEEKRFEQSLDPDLLRQAPEWAGKYQVTEFSEFEKRAFAQMVEELAEEGRKVILIAGQMFPSLEQAIDPAIRPDMLAFLRALEGQHPGKVTVLDQEEFFVPTNEDFSDLLHFRPAAQKRMSQRLAEILKERFLGPETGSNHTAGIP